MSGDAQKSSYFIHSKYQVTNQWELSITLNLMLVHFYYPYVGLCELMSQLFISVELECGLRGATSLITTNLILLGTKS